MEFAALVSDVASELRRAKCIVLTPKSEGLSQSTLQSMLVATVPVVPDAGHHGDVVVDGKSGRLVSHATPDGFESAIDSILNNKELPLHNAQNGKSAAMRNDSPASAIEKE